MRRATASRADALWDSQLQLEKHLLDRRIEQMRAEGVTFVTNAHVGVNVDVQTLRRRVRRDPAGGRKRATARSGDSGAS